MIEMQQLPYSIDALEPFMPQTTLEFHYGKHYRNYVDTTNKLIDGTIYANKTLPEIIKATYGNQAQQAIFNNAAQAWNHQFFWQSMKVNGGGAPQGKLAELIKQQYGSYDKFAQELKQAATTQFGSGWAWVTLDDGVLSITKTSNADTPIAHNQTPILCIDVWEHAYYLDFQNRRADYVTNFLEHLANWPEIK